MVVKMKSIVVHFSIVLFIWIHVAPFVSTAVSDKDIRPNIDITKNGVVFPFFKEIHDGKYEMVEKMLSNVTIDDKGVGLVIAAQAGKDKIADLLIKNGAAVEYKRGSLTPMAGAVFWAHTCHDAASFCNVKDANNVLKVLISHGANVNGDVLGLKYSILQYAASSGLTDTVAFLIKAKADVNYADPDGWTPLHSCVFKHDKVEILELLYENGANVNAQKRDNYTPLHLACLFGREKCVKFLLKHGADRNLKTHDEKIALDLAKANTSNPSARQRIIGWLQMCYKI